MLRYVSRRIKDTVERTCNVLEARRTWTCGNEGVNGYDGSQSSYEQNTHFLRQLGQSSTNSVFEFGLEPKVPDGSNVVSNETGGKNVCNFLRKFAASNESGSKSSGKEDFRERVRGRHHYKVQRNFVDALTWSGALICGWYTSQFLCMKRRNLQNGWNGKCKYAKVLMQPSQVFHSSMLSHWARTAPEKSKHGYVWTFNDDNKFDSRTYKEKSVEPVSNDHLKDANETKAKVAPLKTFDDAVQNLLHILGDIEFQLGVANIQSDRFDLAVSHFKLATSHSHASAAYNLGVCYEEGIGIEKNAKMALDCYILASSLGHKKALYNVGVYHARGLADLPKNRKIARQYFKEAAKLGLHEADKALGLQRPASADIDEPIKPIDVPKFANYQYQQRVVSV
ncbi:hypothetical protein HA402_015066 [Bradysia odoriphaga]|nr:hypothetical protein HA402_015066 [Bradysia odoriphaga]